MSQAFGVRLGLLGFATSIVLAGVGVSTDFVAVATRALVVMLGLWALGTLIGWMADMAVQEGTRREFERMLAELDGVANT